MLDIGVIISGALFAFALFPSIGPQNAGIISHGINRNHMYIAAITCVLADSSLIVLGGIGLSIFSNKSFLLMVNIVGIIFLSYYVVMKMISLIKQRQPNFKSKLLSKSQVILKFLGLTWLNPWVFIDTIVIVGGNSRHYLQAVDSIAFLVGAIIGDFIWFFGITYLASRFSYRLTNPWVPALLDGTTIVIILIVLSKMIFYVVS